MLSETGHFGEDRAKWMEQITEDCIKAMERGVDLKGICIYPVLDRPDWDEGNYIPCGIWGYHPQTGARYADEDYLARVQKCHIILQQYLAKKGTKKVNIGQPRQHQVGTF
jgi:hypothetical protein